MTQREFFGAGAVDYLAEVLDDFHARSVFVVAGRRSYQASGAQASVAAILGARPTYLFTDFEVNPKLGDVQNGVATFRAAPPDAILAVGGGSALDMAKLINCYQANSVRADAVLPETAIRRRGVPLVAIPTTAGSGSEATPFAVVYVGSTKHSVDHSSLLPDVALVDPTLTHSLSPYMTAVTGLDAFSQAVESYWSVHSTAASRSLAAQAVAIAWRALPEAVHAPTDDARRRMSRASNLAGKAIAITRTTGPHALSYALTAHYGVPHGHAVALFLPYFFRYNLEVSADDCTDPRGAGHVHGVVAELCRMLDAPAAPEIQAVVQRFVGSLGVETRFAPLHVSPDALAGLLDEVNQERLQNNPRAFDKKRFHDLVATSRPAEGGLSRLPDAAGQA